MYFGSDNWAGAHPQIAAGLSEAASGFAPAYGNSPLDREVSETFSRVFEHEVDVFFVSTGTAANALALAAVSKPGGVGFYHREAHAIEDECGAPEYLSGGTRLCPVDGPLGRIDPAALGAAIARYPEAFIHAGRPAAASITQSTEIGTVYSLDQIDAVSAVCRDNGIPLHMDGARFANALVTLGCTPAEMTWKRGVDLVSFGGTKNGCWCAEALLVFDRGRAHEMHFLRKRAAQLFSKSRFVAAQFKAYLADDLWLETARHANAMAAQLAAAIDASKDLRLAWAPDANEVFAIVDKSRAAQLEQAGVFFYPWHAPHGYAGTMDANEEIRRLVTSFATTEEHVSQFADLIT